MVKEELIGWGGNFLGREKVASKPGQGKAGINDQRGTELDCLLE